MRGLAKPDIRSERSTAVNVQSQLFQQNAAVLRFVGLDTS